MPVAGPLPSKRPTGLEERPDLWQAWSVVVQQLAGLGRMEEAHSLAREAAERFPLLVSITDDN